MSSVNRSDSQFRDATPSLTLARQSMTNTTEIKISEEEWANGLTHAVGFLGSAIAGVYLIQAVIQGGTVWQALACLIYVTTLVAVYAASTLSHWVSTPRWRDLFRTWDQGLIYLLIVGTYTPLAVAYVHGPWQWVTVAMWTLAIGGFLSKVAVKHRINGISLWLYLALGWMPILVLPCMLVSPSSLWLVLAGGIAYSFGSILLMNDHRGPYLHVGWHLFVMLGSAIHFYAIWRCSIPST